MKEQIDMDLKNIRYNFGVLNESCILWSFAIYIV